MYRNLRRTQWNLYREESSDKLTASDLDKGLGVESIANSLQGCIINSYHEAFPEVDRKTRRQTPRRNRGLEGSRKKI